MIESTFHRVVRLLLRCLLTGTDLLIRTYRLAVSPLLGPCCRFAPSCSAYARQALHRHGLVRGGWMAMKRVLRCHPLHAGGWDPVV